MPYGLMLILLNLRRPTDASRIQAAACALVGARRAWIHQEKTDGWETRPRPPSTLGHRRIAWVSRVPTVGTDGAIEVGVTTKRKKKAWGATPEASKRDRRVKPIRLTDLQPKEDVTGGRKPVFGTRDQQANRANGSTREE